MAPIVPRSFEERERVMSGTLDDMKGRIYEAAAELTDDDRLRREGTVDQMAGKVKERVVAKAKDALTGNTRRPAK